MILNMRQFLLLNPTPYHTHALCVEFCVVSWLVSYEASMQLLLWKAKTDNAYDMMHGAHQKRMFVYVCMYRFSNRNVKLMPTISSKYQSSLICMRKS